MKYLIDTDWVINHLKGESRVVAKLEELVPEGVAISVISLAELYEVSIISKILSKASSFLRSFSPLI